MAQDDRDRRFNTKWKWKAFAALASSAAVLLPMGACSKEEKRAGLVVSVQTDMSIPKDVNAVEIDIAVYGKSVFNERYEIGEKGIYIPATLTLLPPEQAGAPVTIRVLSYQKDEVRTLRRVITTVPDSREALLRMPIQWLCEGEIKKDGEATKSSCDDGSSCLVGSCTADEVDSNTLPDFDDAFVFGGAHADGKGACFDTVPCFAEHTAAEVLGFDADACELDLAALPDAMGSAGGASSGPSKLNFALLSDAGDGICQKDWGCFIPLDQDPVIGWSIEGSTVKVPPGLCKRLETNAALHFVASMACDTKTADIPTCGPWSSVEGSSITVDLSGLTPPGAGMGGEDGMGLGGASPVPEPEPCGDGVIDSGEECDDANTYDADGCSSSCEIEPWYLCAMEPSVCDLRAPGELLSNAVALTSNVYSMAGMVGTDGDLNKPDFYLAGPLTAGQRLMLTVNAPFEGEIWVSDQDTQCSGNACTAYVLKTALLPYEDVTLPVELNAQNVAVRIIAAAPTSAEFSVSAYQEPIACGDGVVDGNEACDDGNTTSGEGCSSTCEVEPNYLCSGSPSYCSMP